ncbi:MAG: hypothetical protein ABSG79_15790 [Bryobacteraceae bacterium]|jgi:hypothetical protein
MKSLTGVLFAIALAASSFVCLLAQDKAQLPPPATQAQDKSQIPQPETTTESAEHKYARQKLEPVAKRLDELMRLAEANGERMKSACSYLDEPNSGRPVFRAHEKSSEKKEALANYEARKDACQKAVADNTAAEAAAVAIESSRLEIKLKHADECAAVYQKTIDEKASDVTTRETEQIKACQSIDLYPPAK